MKSISGTNKRSTMELGGKAANIIFEDAPLDQLLKESLMGYILIKGTFVVLDQDCLSRISL